MKLAFRLDAFSGYPYRATFMPFRSRTARVCEKYKKTTEKTIAVWDTILNSREPVKLLFSELPTTLGFSPFNPTASMPEEIVFEFVMALKRSLTELKMAFPALKERLKTQILEAFNITEKMTSKYKSHISERAEKVAIAVTERKVKAFSLRLFDDSLPETEGIESVACFLLSKPPGKWTDFDEDKFNQELAQRAQQFSRVESIIFPNNKKYEKNIGMRLALTKSNGKEQEKVFFISPEEEKEIKGLQDELSKLIKSDKNGIVAAYKAIWDIMSQKDKKKNG